MARKRKRNTKKQKVDQIEKNRNAALAKLRSHPLFAPVFETVRVDVMSTTPSPQVWVQTTSEGVVLYNKSCMGSVGEWQWVFAHALVHLGLGHLDEDHMRRGVFDYSWNTASCVAVNRFLDHLKLGKSIVGRVEYPKADEETLAERFRVEGVPEMLGHIGTAGPSEDIVWRGPPHKRERTQEAFAQGLQAAVSAALHVAAGAQADLYAYVRPRKWGRAIQWFISSYPLLGGLLASLEVIENAEACRSMEITTAAVNPVVGELYLNPDSFLSFPERCFVVAHELLHVGLRHDVRRDGRDPWLWNVACDYAINSWLIEMEVGVMPESCLYDPLLKGESAEGIYDQIVNDLRKYRKLATLRGVNKVDVLEDRVGLRGEEGGTDLDAFYRRALATGMRYHLSAGRGLLPAGLIEEIKTLEQPPIPWDVELARWFDDRFQPIEARRTYLRPSRRQGATPDIPRPSYQKPQVPVFQRTFGVVIDTSGSMDRLLLGKALGAISSYSTSRDILAARVIFCDAAAYDAGYLSPQDIAGRVKVRGRGGTRLQPGIELLATVKDFPKDGPILIITDGYCDNLTVRRDHAYLVPQGARLPFTARGPVFKLK